MADRKRRCCIQIYTLSTEPILVTSPLALNSQPTIYSSCGITLALEKEGWRHALNCTMYMYYMPIEINGGESLTMLGS